jgi:hypothetical protein
MAGAMSRAGFVLIVLVWIGPEAVKITMRPLRSLLRSRQYFGAAESQSRDDAFTRDKGRYFLNFFKNFCNVS